MTRYVQRRLLLIIPTVLLTSLVVFLMLYLIPGDPASIYLGENQATPERIAALRHTLGFDRPLYVQYADFLWKAVHDAARPRLRAAPLPARCEGSPD